MRTMYQDEYDMSLRSAAFAFLDGLSVLRPGPVRFEDLAQFRFGDERIALMDPQRGIRKPKQLDAALSFRTVYARRPQDRPYVDEVGSDGYLRYKWRGADPEQNENQALRKACERRLPLIWFQGVASGLYWPIYPIWLAGEEPFAQQFIVALDDEELDHWDHADVLDVAVQRRYADRVAKVRLHQPVFRERVLVAYGTRCAICRLRHRELLEAAHILADSEGGTPIVPNGISLCRIHHGAFDHLILGIRPDFTIEVRADILDESDGPTLRHALQAVHGQKIELPRERAARPDPSLLRVRYERFQAAS
ncbi:MAG: HNH endonuclease [Acidimicrobiales bacterium]